MEHDKKLLLKFLAEVIRFDYNMSGAQFNQIPDRPTNERTYRTLWGTWKNAKWAALKIGLSTKEVPKDLQWTEKDEAIVKTTPVFDFKAEQNSKMFAELRKEVVALKKERLSTEEVRRYIFDLKDAPVAIPDWVVKDRAVNPSAHGVPTLLLSDWHYGEVVDPNQIFGVNEFGLKEADNRVRFLANGVVDILQNHLSSAYPGIVLVLAGDFVSGTIHEELLISNEKPIMPVVVQVYNNLIWFIERMKELVGKVQCFCVHGNHSRTFRKPIYKESALSSYDWLIYTLLDRYFQNDKAVGFNIASGDDLQFKIYNHKYRVTHGAQFRGGTGFIGSLAPIVRGEIKKRTTAETLDINYDTLLMGHFHQYMMLPHVIANGSLIGYNEYAFSNNFPFERPQQALWLTHPIHGITFSCPVFCTKDKVQKNTGTWVSWKEDK